MKHAVALPALLLLATLAAGCARRPAPPPVPTGVDVQRYEMEARLEPQARRLEARVRIVVHHADTVTRLPLTLSGMEVGRVTVDGAPVAAVRTGAQLVVPLAPGREASIVEIGYAGVPPEGLYRGEHAGQTVVYTDSWPDRVRGWMPGVHHPSDPAAFSLTLDVPQGYEAVASGAPPGAAGAWEEAGAWRRYRWRLDVPAPTYTYAFAVADFSLTETTLGDTLPVRYYMLAADSVLAGELGRTPQMIAYFSELVGPYPFAQYASVQVPFAFAGMENASASFLQARLFGRGGAEETQAHEVAHQWFGDRVVVAGWRDLWLSEGFATYLTTLFYEHADGVEDARQRWVAMAEVTPARLASHHALVPEPPVDPNDHLTWVPYQKGGSVLHLLRLRLGDEAFFAAVRETYRRYAGRALSTEAFRDLLESAGGADLGDVFDFWVYGHRLPRLDATWDASARRLRWNVRDDAGTLRDVPFLLQVRQGPRVTYLPAAGREAALDGWDEEAPDVRPVGIMLVRGPVREE